MGEWDGIPWRACRLTCLDKLEDSEKVLGVSCQGRKLGTSRLAGCLLFAEFTLEWSRPVVSALVNRQCTCDSKGFSTSGKITDIWLCVRLARNLEFIERTTHSLVCGGACAAGGSPPRRNFGCIAGTEKGGGQCVTRMCHERDGME